MLLMMARHFVQAHDKILMLPAPAQESPGDMTMDSKASGVSGFAFQGTNAHVILRSQAARQHDVSEGLAPTRPKKHHPAYIAQSHPSSSLQPAL